MNAFKRTDEAYIGLELGTHTWNVDIGNNAMEDILDEGIECYPEDVYALIYKGYSCSEEKLKMMLDEPDNSDNMLYPLDCFRDLSYDKWLEYKKEWEVLEEEARQRAKESK